MLMEDWYSTPLTAELIDLDDHITDNSIKIIVFCAMCLESAIKLHNLILSRKAHMLHVSTHLLQHTKNNYHYQFFL